MPVLAKPVCTLQQQESLESERLQHATAQFATALAASCFADREAFLAALLDEETIRHLEQRKQTLESQLQQAIALSGRADGSYKPTSISDRKG